MLHRLERQREREAESGDRAPRRGTRGRPGSRPLRASAVVSVLVCLLSTAAGWAHAGRPAARAAAGAMPTPTASPAVSEDARAWMESVEHSRASVPAWVDSFSDLVELLSAQPATSTAAPDRSTPGEAAHLVYLPLVSNYELGSRRVLGSVTYVGPTTPCDNEECFDVTIKCQQLGLPDTATLKVGSPQGPARGTIYFAGGYDGTYFWENSGSNYASIIHQLQAEGFRTVQVEWHTGWWRGTANDLEGTAKLACPSATMLAFVNNNLHAEPGTPYCAEGHSNGASEIGFAIAQYGLADRLALVLFESGPNFARVDCGCIRDPQDPALQALFYARGGRSIINASLGLPVDTGACVAQDVGFLDHFQEASLAWDTQWQYSYPGTMAAFVFGESDLGTTAVHGLYYYNRIVGAGTPLVSISVVPGAGHFVADTPQGMSTILDALLDNCVIQ